MHLQIDVQFCGPIPQELIQQVVYTGTAQRRAMGIPAKQTRAHSLRKD
jgi:hypothetical protein